MMLKGPTVIIWVKKYPSGIKELESFSWKHSRVYYMTQRVTSMQLKTRGSEIRGMHFLQIRGKTNDKQEFIIQNSRNCYSRS
jgi:hypothetical protein